MQGGYPGDLTAKANPAPWNLTEDFCTGGTLKLENLEENRPKFEGPQICVTWLGN